MLAHRPRHWSKIKPLFLHFIIRELYRRYNSITFRWRLDYGLILAGKAAHSHARDTGVFYFITGLVTLTMAGDRILVMTVMMTVMTVIVVMMLMTLVVVSGDPVPYRINQAHRVRHNHDNRTVRRRPNRFGSRITRDLQHQGASQKQLGDRITRDLQHQGESQKQLGDRITRDLQHQGASQKQLGDRITRDLQHQGASRKQLGDRITRDLTLQRASQKQLFKDNQNPKERSRRDILVGRNKLGIRAKGDPAISEYYLNSAESYITADTRTAGLEKAKGDTGHKLLNKLIRMRLTDYYKSDKDYSCYYGNNED